MQLSPSKGSILHLHTTFLPKTELWIPRLLNEVKGYSHISCAGRYDLEGAKNVEHVQFFQHRMGKVMEQRLNSHRWRRGLAIFRLALTGGESSAAYLSLKTNNVKPALIHAHFGDVGCTYLPLARRLKLPFVVSFYGWDYLKLLRQKPIYYKRYRELFASASAVIAEGPAAAASLISLGAPREKVQLINLGTKIPSQTTSSVLIPSFQILQVASLTEKKGQLLTIQAFELIAGKFPKAKLLLIGDSRDPNYANQVKVAIESSDFKSRIELKDFIALEKLTSVFKEARVFVQPSQTAQDGDSEGGAPVAILDAQANGVPVIVSDHCDLPFVAADLGWNVPVAAGDVLALSQALSVCLARNGDQLQNDRIRSYKYVKEQFSVEKWGFELQKLYTELISH